MTASLAIAAAWISVAVSLSMARRRGARSLACRRVLPPRGLEGRVGDPVENPARVSSVAAAVHGRRARRSSRQDLIALVDELTSALASGVSPTQAMAYAARLPGPLAADLSRAAGQVRLGRATQEVLDEWAAKHAGVGAVLVADALALADATGGSRTRALAGVRSTLREAEGLAAEIRALATQTRLSATVLTVLPVGFAALVAVADSRIASFLLGTPAGWFCLAGGGTLDALGAWWMQRLTGALR